MQIIMELTNNGILDQNYVNSSSTSFRTRLLHTSLKYTLKF